MPDLLKSLISNGVSPYYNKYKGEGFISKLKMKWELKMFNNNQVVPSFYNVLLLSHYSDKISNEKKILMKIQVFTSILRFDDFMWANS